MICFLISDAAEENIFDEKISPLLTEMGNAGKSMDRI